MLDKIQSRSGFNNWQLQHRRDVSALCVFRRYIQDTGYPISQQLEVAAEPEITTRKTIQRHRKHLKETRCRTSQFSRTFIPSTIKLWNGLSQNIVDISLQFRRTFIPSTIKLWNGLSQNIVDISSQFRSTFIPSTMKLWNGLSQNIVDISSQFRRTFIPSTIKLWNGLSQNIVDISSAQGFKVAVNLVLHPRL